MLVTQLPSFCAGRVGHFSSAERLVPAVVLAEKLLESLEIPHLCNFIFRFFYHHHV